MVNIVEHYSFGGWPNCIKIENEALDLICTTDVGPRIVRFAFKDGSNLFKEIKQDQGQTGGKQWRGYGGHRLWHSPEAKPRTYYPDNAPVDYKIEDQKVCLIQETEPTTGLQKQMEITLLATNQVKVVHRIINRNLWEIKYAPWSLTVMDTGGTAIIPQEPYVAWEDRLAPVRPMVLWGYTDMSDSRWNWGTKYIQLKQDPHKQSKQKLGVLNTRGWMAYVLGDQVFIKKSEYKADYRYPDFGVNQEVYTDAQILEMETLGSYQSVASGDYAEHTEYWYLFKAKIGTEEDSIDKNLLPLINRG